jgi:hypothetical protein
VRLAGWGPLFSGVLLISVGGLFLGFRRRRVDWSLIALAVAIMFTIVIVPRPWYARYTPQLWLLPLMGCAFFGRATLMVGGIAAFANVAMIAVPSMTAALHRSAELRSQLDTLASQHRVYSVWFGDYGINKARFDENHLRYHPMRDPFGPADLHTILAGAVLTSQTQIAVDK